MDMYKTLNIIVLIVFGLLLIFCILFLIIRIINVKKDNTMFRNVTNLLNNIANKLKNDLEDEKLKSEVKKVNTNNNKKRKKNNKQPTLFDELDINLDLEQEEEITKIPDNAFKVERVSKKNNAQALYDFKMVLPNKILFIKIIPNFSNAEICMNNAVKWQIKKSFNDKSNKFIDVDEFVRFDPQKEIDYIKTSKVALIYPHSNTILRYINECEMKFVTPKNDLNGLFVMTYQNLVDNYKDIKCEGKKI